MIPNDHAPQEQETPDSEDNFRDSLVRTLMLPSELGDGEHTIALDAEDPQTFMRAAEMLRAWAEDAGNGARVTISVSIFQRSGFEQLPEA